MAGEGGGEGPGVVPVRHLVVRREVVEVVQPGVPLQVAGLLLSGVLSGGRQGNVGGEEEDGEEGENHGEQLVGQTDSHTVFIHRLACWSSSHNQ